MQTIKPKP